jgi:hypothetical protein
MIPAEQRDEWQALAEAAMTLSEEDVKSLHQAIRNWEDFGGPVLDGVVPAVERIVARHRAEAWDEGFSRGFYKAQARYSDDSMDASEVDAPNPYAERAMP